MALANNGKLNTFWPHTVLSAALRLSNYLTQGLLINACFIADQTADEYRTRLLLHNQLTISSPWDNTYTFKYRAFTKKSISMPIDHKLTWLDLSLNKPTC